MAREYRGGNGQLYRLRKAYKRDCWQIQSSLLKGGWATVYAHGDFETESGALAMILLISQPRWIQKLSRR